MKTIVVVFSLAVTPVVTPSVFAQTRSFGSVVFPGGTSSTTPGITRNFGSVVFPGGASVPTVRGAAPGVGVFPPAGTINPFPVRGSNGFGSNGFGRVPSGRGTRNQPYVYAYPVFVGGGYGYGGGYDNGYAPQDQGPQGPPPQPQQQPPNVTVVYPPPSSQHASPVMIQAGPDGEFPAPGQRQGATIYESPNAGGPVEVQPEPSSVQDTNHYLIAFKDHTIYSAVAYWADGDTLHYFTSGNTHNQASVSLIDRELTERLNKELGIDFKLPPAR